ncbi:DUF927 domain-containing protein [Bosea sp. NBC_00550]|uniref:DUF927 domain-containing protein n=1 Tax=Bosea sp. NBC_00550 TaxID=2969621 RepID=UPI002230F47B|nr:DUF927 domain-containing protein [Bosea sp. NBC_00550]UZF92073.1 DUF927 domain-containing protein [Bosea sp. NBC_00550]
MADQHHTGEDPFRPIDDDERDAGSAKTAEGSAPDDYGDLVSPVPGDAPPLPTKHPVHGEPTAIYVYRDQAGAVTRYVFRFDLGGGGKMFTPYTVWRKDGVLKWHAKDIPAPKGLYNLDQLAARPDAAVVVCEGEKAADAAAKIYPKSVVITSSGGSHAAAKSDWSPVSGRKVLIWPDNDEPGRKYAQAVAKTLHGLGCAVMIIDAEALASAGPDGDQRGPAQGWDAADALAEWSDLVALLKAANGAAKAFDSGPSYVSYDNYTMTAGGLTAQVEKRRGNTKRVVDVRLSAPFEILGACRDPHGRCWGKILRWPDADGRVHVRHVTDAVLQGNPASLCAALADDGLAISREHQPLFAGYLSGAQVKGRVTLVDCTGWHDIGGSLVFVLPEETIGPRGSEAVILDSAASGPYAKHGTLKDWQGGVGALASGHALPVIAVSTALAGPLLHLAGQEGGGVHIFGISSKGKTTLLQMGASVWGRGASPGYLQAWRATANGLEGAAAGASDTVLVLDEMGTVDAREAGASIYSLSNGSGKQRAGRTGDLRKPKSWRVLTLSSGEIPLEAKLTEHRAAKPRAGQLVRMIDVPADRGRGFGVFDDAGPEGDAGKLARSCKQAAISAYGTAGPEFVRRLIDRQITGDDIGKRIADFTAAHVPVGSDGQVERAAQRLGLIAAAGELATELGVTPWKRGEATAAAAWALVQWIEFRGGSEPAEVRQAIEQVRLFIERHGGSRFEDLDLPDAHPVNNRAGWRKGKGDDLELMILPQVWKQEICAGLDPIFVAKTLYDRGMLEKAKDGYQPVRKICGRNHRVYVLTSGIFDGAKTPSQRADSDECDFG